jgi:hypothetical protein
MGFVHRGGELRFSYLPGKVEQRSPWVRERNAVAEHPVTPLQSGAVQTDSASPCSRPACDRDVERIGIGWVREELQEPRGTEVTQYRARATGEDGREFESSPRGGAVAEQVDPSVQRMEHPAGDP